MDIQINKKYLYAIMSLLFAFGVFFHWLPSTKGYTIGLTEVFLALWSTIGIYLLYKNTESAFKVKNLLAIATFWVITFIIEAVGVKTGLIFGSYSYGNVLGLQLFKTPIIIGLNWVITVFGAYYLANLFLAKLKLKPVALQFIVSSLITATLAVVFDYFLEPVAIGLNYWFWPNNSVPLQNYMAWFIISFIMAMFINKLKFLHAAIVKDEYLGVYFITQICFFILLQLVL